MEPDSKLIKNLEKHGFQITGSRAFFENMPGFQPHDADYYKVYSNPPDFHYHKHVHKNGVCVISVAKRPLNELFEFFKEAPWGSLNAMGFLTPSQAKELGFDFVRDHELLEPFFDKLNERHKYYKVIYDSYLENGKMVLTDEQREKAYQVYLQARQKR